MKFNTEAHLLEFSAFVQTVIGLSFPDGRRGELRRGLEQMVQDGRLGPGEDSMLTVSRSAPTRSTVEMLGQYFSTGETYFFRDANIFGALESGLLPQLVDAKRANGCKSLRILSAGCCTGEEAYSLAILVSGLISDASEWTIRIIGADINPIFLLAADAGVYGDWSFRGVPHAVRRRYFCGTSDGKYAISETIKRCVDFQHVNLAGIDYGPLEEAAPFDIIVCQNVLMYFGEEQWRHAIGKFHALLGDDGWLVVSSIEGDPSKCPGFRAMEMAGAIFYRRCGSCNPSSIGEQSKRETRRADFSKAEGCTPALSSKLRMEGDPQRGKHERRTESGGTEENRISAALDANRSDPELHYALAAVLEEQGRVAEAFAEVRGALYLDQRFVLAHFLLGCLYCRERNAKKALRSFDDALLLLRELPDTAVIPQANGMSPATLTQLIEARKELL